MKLTSKEIRHVIKEEIRRVVKEYSSSQSFYIDGENLLKIKVPEKLKNFTDKITMLLQDMSEEGRNSLWMLISSLVENQEEAEEYFYSLLINEFIKANSFEDEGEIYSRLQIEIRPDGVNLYKVDIDMDGYEEVVASEELEANASKKEIYNALTELKGDYGYIGGW